MNETGARYTQQQHSDPRLQQAYNTALLQFQAYLLEKTLAGEAKLTKTSLVKMISYN
jgi:hypothetical protein